MNYASLDPSLPEREFRRRLNKHLYQMHGGFSRSDELDLEQLSDLHRIFHLDKFLSVPHKHDDGSGQIIDTPPDNYIDMAMDTVKNT